MREHLLGFGAEQDGREALTAVARHEDDVAVVLLGLFDDRLGGREALHHEGGRGHPDFIAAALGVGKTVLGLGGHALVVLLDRFRTVFGKIRVGVRLDDGDEHERSAERLGKAGGALHGLFRHRRAVGRNQNALVHDVEILFTLFFHGAVLRGTTHILSL